MFLFPSELSCCFSQQKKKVTFFGNTAASRAEGAGEKGVCEMHAHTHTHTTRSLISTRTVPEVIQYILGIATTLTDNVGKMFLAHLAAKENLNCPHRTL